MKLPFTISALLLWATLFGQNCSCVQDTTLKERVSCNTIKFDNRAKLYWNFNCDSSWLTFESPKHIKTIIFSLELVDYTGRLGYNYAGEYKYKFLIQNNLISGCCEPPEFFLFDKTNGRVTDSLGRIIFFSENRKFPFIIGLTNHNNTLTVYNVDEHKKYFIELQKWEIEKEMRSNGDLFAEYLFERPIIKGSVIKLTYLLNKSKRTKAGGEKTIIIDLKKYSG